MTDILYPNFLKDPNAYAQAEDHWKRLWTTIMEQSPQSDDWKEPWMTGGLMDGTVLREGNPIFTAWSPSERKGVRVIQYEPSESSPELTYWFDSVGEDAPDFNSVTELVIACTLSKLTSIEALVLMSDWVAGKSRVPAIYSPNESPDALELIAA